MELKYFVGDEEITEEEYFEYLYEDARECRVPSPKKTSKEVMQENKETAERTGQDIWHCETGAKLTIKQSLETRLDKIKEYAEVLHNYARASKEYVGDEYQCLVDLVEEVKNEIK